MKFFLVDLLEFIYHLSRRAMKFSNFLASFLVTCLADKTNHPVRRPFTQQICTTNMRHQYAPPICTTSIQQPKINMHHHRFPSFFPEESTPNEPSPRHISPLEQAPAIAVSSCSAMPLMPRNSINRRRKLARQFPTMTANTQVVVYWPCIDAVHQ